MSTPIPSNIPQLPPEKVAELIEDRKAQAEANRIPFPGAARDAFAPPLAIQVGSRSVRPFYDGDVDILEALNHPLHKMAFAPMADDSGWGEDLGTVRGQMGYNLCYLMTIPVAEMEEFWETSPNPVAEFQIKARAMFRRCQIRELVAIQKAAFHQFHSYFGPVIDYDSTENGKQKKMSSTEKSASSTDSVGDS